MMMFAAMLLGFVSYNSMRVELNPEVSFGVVTISTVYPGANPDTVNTQISKKVEEAVASVNGVREITSNSREGISLVLVQLEIGINQDVALNDVRTKVDSVVNDLPKDALKPTVTKFDSTSSPALFMSVSSNKLNGQQLRDLVDDKFKDRFGQIGGVASVGVEGGDLREIQVRLKPASLLAYGIGITDVQRAIVSANLDIPGGKLKTDKEEISVRVLNQFEQVDKVRELRLSVSDPNRMGGKGKIVRLGDVADIVDTVKERDTKTLLNGNETISIAVIKAKDGNAVEITKQARDVMTSLTKEYADQGIKFEVTYEDAKQITESLHDLNLTLFIGIVLVCAIVYIFLHNFRGTMIVALAIPTSIFASFIAMKLAGFTINNLSLLALSLAVGVLVDDAIVVLENIYRHLKMGEDPREAAINGRSEIGLAAIAITLADVVVFLPIGFMGGIVGQFFKPLALGFVFATLFSLFVSFTLTPMLASRWYRRGEDVEHPNGRFAQWFERMFAKFENVYRRALEWSLNHRWFVFILGNLALAAVFNFIGGSFIPSQIPKEAIKPGQPIPPHGIGGAFAQGMGMLMPAIIIGIIVTVVNLIRHKRFSPKYLLSAVAFAMIFPVATVGGYLFGQWKKEAVFKFQFFPVADNGKVNASIELPPGASLQETQKVVDYVSKIFQSDPDVKFVLSTTGVESGNRFAGGSASSNFAQIDGTLYEKRSFSDKFGKPKEHLRDRSDQSVAADLLAKVGRYPGAKITVGTGDGFGFGAAIQLSFTSENRNLLMPTALKVKELLESGAIPGVINVNLSSKPGKSEIQAIPDSERMADANVTVAELGAAVRTMYSGNDDSKLRVNGREYGIRVMLDPKDRDNPNLLQTVPIKFVQGSPVRVGDVAKLQTVPSVTKIDRRNRGEEIKVDADLLPGFSAGTVQADIDKALKDRGIVPEGVKYKPLGQADSQQREMGYLLGAMGFGLILVYILLASLYDNIVYPFIIQLSQPQAMVGALLALVISDKALNIVGFIGLIALIGLVGKNAILLVDYTNTLRSRGRDRHDALVEAGPTRLRPIMMTTIALILGMLPVALALGKGSEFRETIGITILGGITLSTFLTLLVIPCSYTIFDDLSQGVGKLMRRGRPEPIAEVVEGASTTTVDESEKTPQP